LHVDLCRSTCKDSSGRAVQILASVVVFSTGISELMCSMPGYVVAVGLVGTKAFATPVDACLVVGLGNLSIEEWRFDMMWNKAIRFC